MYILLDTGTHLSTFTRHSLEWDYFVSEKIVYYVLFVQVLIHTPLLRDYFLSDRHVCTFSTVDQCVVCEIERMFQVREEKWMKTIFKTIFKLSLNQWLQIH